MCNRHASVFGFGHFLWLVLLPFALKSDFSAHLSDNDGTASSNLMYFSDQVVMEMYLWNVIENILSSSLGLSSSPEKLVLIFVGSSGSPHSPWSLSGLERGSTACICLKWGGSLPSSASQTALEHSLPLKGLSCKELSSTSWFLYWSCTKTFRTSLVDKNLPPMQETWARSLVREDSTCHGATKPACHNCWSLLTLGPLLCHKRSHCSEKPVHHNED